MLKTDSDRRICEEYGRRDAEGHVHCFECPLLKGNPAQYDFRCRANSHYDGMTGEWERDDEG